MTAGFSRLAGRFALLAGVTGVLLLLPSGVASAHPLGNFTVNHYNGLTMFPDRVELHAVVDSAEIPTLQEQPESDTDGDGTISDAEGGRYAAKQCDQLSAEATATVDGEPLRWSIDSAAVEYPPGQADLPLTRLTCELSATADLARPATFVFTDSYRPDRIGWREITATGAGIGLPDSPVPAQSISNELRSYPNDLLSSPLDRSQVRLRTVPGGVSSIGTDAFDAPASVGGMQGLLGQATERFNEVVGVERLTPLIGGLAIVLSLVLGAAHAALPGHGKTVMAAYLAGRSGTRRDALLVGATVTITHTAGVLVVGLLISAFSTLVGENVLGWLGVISGLLVAAIGVSLLRTALRARRAAAEGLVASPLSVPALVGAGHGHGHGHSHSHGHSLPTVGRLSRTSLVGMGVAGGLVPSPSALLVLFSAVALSRTWFGVVLVLGYGLGMAATLTAVGLLLVRLRDRVERMTLSDRLRRRTAWFVAAMPVLTALLVLVVGLGLAARGLTGTV